LIIYVKVESEILLPRLDYVLAFINGHPQLGGKIQFLSQEPREDHKKLYYGGSSGSKAMFMPARQMFFQNRVVDTRTLKLNAYSFEQSRIFGVGKEERKERPFFDGSTFAFDVFETLFFHLSRYEECFPGDKNSRESDDILVKKANLEQEPLVDQLVIALVKALGLKLDVSATSYLLTHDIDKIYKYNHGWDAIKAFAWPIVYRQNLLWGWKNITGYFQVRKGKSKDPYDTYDFLFRSESKWKKKIVFFMAGGESPYDLYDQSYAKNLPMIWALAKDKGYEIGLHPSYKTAEDATMMEAEKKNLEKLSQEKLRNTRQHFLRYFFPKSSKIIEKSGFELDSTLGFTRWIGFRTGTGYAHHLYDFEEEKAFSFQVLPLVVMDSSLIHQTRDDMEKFRSTLFAFLKRNRMGTQITFNFHNSTFDSTLSKRKKLRSILDELEEVFVIKE
jgi:hypothetical protein